MAEPNRDILKQLHEGWAPLKTEVEPLVGQFDSITLSEMDDVALMDRIDSKYVIPRSKITELLCLLQPDYRLLDIKGNRLTDYHNLYYDGQGLPLYIAHHNGKLNRYKVRKRQYAGSGIQFLELKFKSNRGRTVKSRIRIPEFEMGLSEVEQHFLRENSPLDPSQLQVSTGIHFRRITFVNKKLTDRCTLDIGLSCNHDNRLVSHPHFAICEIKSSRFSRGNDFIRALEKLSVRPLRISKYCTAVLDLYPGVKYNRFKQKVRYLERLKFPQHDRA